MFFRPLPRFTAVFLPMFLVLVGLGVWQIQRLHWKLGLIAEMNAHLHAPPASLDTLLSLPVQEAQYRRVALTGRFDNAHEAFAYATDANGLPVYHVIVPFRQDDGREIMVDRGIIPLRLKAQDTRRAGIREGEQKVVGVWREPDTPGLFTPAPDLAGRVWFARDVTGIAKAFHLHLAASDIVEADATPVPGGWPRGGQTVVTLRNDHLQYALTWFLMAIALLVVYFTYHRSRGRLGWRR